MKYETKWLEQRNFTAPKGRLFDDECAYTVRTK